MASCEKIIQRLVPQKETTTKRGVPYIWCYGPFDETISIQEKGVIHQVDRPITVVDLPEAALGLFRSNDALEETVAVISGNRLIKEVKGCFINFGAKALMLLHQVIIDDGTLYFVTYLSRGSLDTKLGKETEMDFNNLKFLATQFKKNLTPETLLNHRVVDPVAFGVYTWQGDDYPFYTMPFIPDADEITIRLTQYNIPAIQGGIASVEYAVPSDKKTKYVNEKTIGQIAAAKTKFTKLFNKHGRVNEELLNEVEPMPAHQNYRGRRKDLLIQMLLIYYLSFNRFPLEFQVSAGDIMARIAENSLENITLITVRGGFSQELTLDDFFRRLQNHDEPYYARKGQPTNHVFPPFFDLKQEDFDRLNQQVQQLMR